MTSPIITTSASIYLLFLSHDHKEYKTLPLWRQYNKKINACRIYLKVITVSDLTSTNGLDIIPSMLNGHRNPSFHNTLKWPTQKKPSQEYWTLFKDCILDTYCKPNSYRLKRPLGAWTHQKIHYINWYTYIHPTTNLLIKFNPQHTVNKWSNHHSINSHSTTYNHSTGISI